MQGVVPVGVKGIGDEMQGLHLGIGHGELRGVAIGIHPQTSPWEGLRIRAASVAENARANVGVQAPSQA